ncbi:hypothetical protein F3Y22_tig00111837pilonHSYRG00144 [Hibiscus syriacus]|uniref:RRM domain-containing protein n=1 Tax=Hibiscus syriacus TaxID=106335 RepID=A0A6A2XBE2_HIBSY|nr:hypothetical protein F3Y22_tig00111837pilonHSYRG00144 [Hibiscus syriacus]
MTRGSGGAVIVTLFVDNLPSKLHWKGLWKIFGRQGGVSSMFIASKGSTRRSRFAFARTGSRDDALWKLQRLNGLIINDSRISVAMSSRQAMREIVCAMHVPTRWASEAIRPRLSERAIRWHPRNHARSRRECMATYKVARSAWRPTRSPGGHGDLCLWTCMAGHVVGRPEGTATYGQHSAAKCSNRPLPTVSRPTSIPHCHDASPEVSKSTTQPPTSCSMVSHHHSYGDSPSFTLVTGPKRDSVVAIKPSVTCKKKRETNTDTRNNGKRTDEENTTNTSNQRQEKPKRKERSLTLDALFALGNPKRRRRSKHRRVTWRFSATVEGGRRGDWRRSKAADGVWFSLR